MKFSIASPYFPKNEIDWILSKFQVILKGDGMLSMGDYVKEFERKFAEYIKIRFAVGTNSCSAALAIAMRAMSLQPGEEVIVPAQTFITTGSEVVRAGGRPVFAEVDLKTFCLSLDSIKEKVTENTRAVIIVHMGGIISPDIFRIKEFCDKNDLVLIEDAAHAHGASINGKKAGCLGHIGCFSFYPTKMITTAEGGMLVTDNEDLYKKAVSYRNRGLDLNAEAEQYTELGTNNRMTEIAALMGLSQLRCLDEFVAKRNQIASIYNDKIAACDQNILLKPVTAPKNITHSYWRYSISLDPKINRKELKALMKKDGIPIDWAYYPPLHLQPVFINMYGNKRGMLPGTEELLEHNICLPMHVRLETKDCEYIVNKLLGHVQALNL